MHFVLSRSSTCHTWGRQAHAEGTTSRTLPSSSNIWSYALRSALLWSPTSSCHHEFGRSQELHWQGHEYLDSCQKGVRAQLIPSGSDGEQCLVLVQRRGTWRKYLISTKPSRRLLALNQVSLTTVWLGMSLQLSGQSHRSCRWCLPASHTPRRCHPPRSHSSNGCEGTQSYSIAQFSQPISQ